MTHSSTTDDGPSKDLGEKLFRFFLYTDSHVNQAEHESMSPHQVNKLANGRHRYVLNAINAVAPDFAIHMGDLVHPVPVMAIYADAADRFHEQTAELNCPLHVMPGNHDVGDKPIKWGPAEIVSDESLALWEKHFGPHFHGFEHGGCRFLLLNAQIINSGLGAEAAQRDWLEKELAETDGQRVFVFIHYPPFVFSPDELEYYDNIAEPGRSWLLGLFESHDVEAVFSGHVHNFWYHRHGRTQCYVLPSITFVRHDYSEMYRVPAGPEAGRNDAVKLGYFVVDVHEGGHLCHPIRTYGRTLEPDDPAPATPTRVAPLHPIQNRHAAMGVDLRQPWAEVVEIPPNSGLDEFARKIVRNDYPLLALWEMGVRRLRVPLQDLTDARVRDRMRDLKALGMRFTVFSFEMPDGAYRDALARHGDLIDAWEVGFAWPDLDDMLSGIEALKSEASLKVYLSKLRSKEDLETDGQSYYHVINHGFVAGERRILEDVLERRGDLIEGFVFRIPRERSAWDELLAIGETVEAVGTQASVHVRLATSNPAGEAVDDLANANRVAETLAASVTQRRVKSY
ncbi:MAG: metallophosphoesterase family protein, partial [Methyloligellaceae bacterium]